MDPAHAEILLLEDSSLDAELISEYLHRGGVAHRIERVWTREGFEKALARGTHRMVLADYTLPAFDGLSALDMVVARAPEVPFIVVSATLGEEIAIEALKRGATDYVAKERLNRLPDAVKRAFREAREKAARLQAEEQLREVNARLASMVEERTRERDLVWRVSRDLFLICTLDGLTRSVNPAWSDALGYPETDLLGLRFETLVHPEDAGAMRQAFEHLAIGTPLDDFEIRVRRKDGGYRRYLWNCVPTDDGVFYAAGRDITERHELEAQLRQVQKMESLGQLTGGVAHDFNNLLTVILGSFELLQRRITLDPQSLQSIAIDNGIRGAQRAAGLTRSLLAFSRRQSLDPKPIEANHLVLNMSDLLSRTLGEHISIETARAGSLWRAHADPNQLESAILNLAVNARDAMGSGGGTLRIETANVVLDRSYCAQHYDAAPGEYVGIFVTDTGPGMDEEVMSQAFEPFFTTKDVGHGTGLGLSQVYGFVKQSGGHVRLESELGVGTTVRIYLPRHVGADGVRSGGDDSLAVPARSRAEMVLVVEDDEDVRRYAVASLGELGYRVVEAMDGHSALSVLDRNPEVGLLFTDVGLPGGMNGRQLAEEAVRRRPNLKVLFATAYARSTVLQGSGYNLDKQLIAKPYGFAALASRLRQILDGGRDAD